MMTCASVVTDGMKTKTD